MPAISPKLENHPLFPERIKVEFAEVLPDGSLRMRVWERSPGITMACGTGACATTAAAALNHKTGRKSFVRMDGGDLQTHRDEEELDTRNITSHTITNLKVKSYEKEH